MIDFAAATATIVPPKDQARCLSDVEVAKLIRKELKAAFPAVKFSVRSENSVRVRYTDGPTPDRVEAIVSQFEGKSFDGMTDSTTYRPPFLYQGAWVYTYCYVFVTRELSGRFVERIAAALASYYDITAPAVVEGFVRPTMAEENECQRATWSDWGQMIYRASRNRMLVTPQLQPAESQ
jgi:hypothetical protein